MFGSLKIGSVFGITIRVSWLFVPLLALIFAGALASGWPNVALLFLLFGSVFLHELGHSLVAQSFGIRVMDITFWPLGGMARMSEIPENPRIEALIAFAGPAVNFLLALLSLPVLFLVSAPAFGPMPAELVGMFILLNLILGGFNLIPAFPMDGGRLLRAALGTRGDWVRATEQAVRFGRFVALAMAIVGVFAFGRGLWLLPLIAIFVWFAGAQELAGVRLRHGRSPLTGQPLFGGAFANSFPGAGSAGAAPFGFGRPEPAPAAAAAHPAAPRTVDVEPRGARRPDTVVVDDLRDLARDGFDDDAVRRLERFRGRLRRPSEG